MDGHATGQRGRIHTARDSGQRPWSLVADLIIGPHNKNNNSEPEKTVQSHATDNHRFTLTDSSQRPPCDSLGSSKTFGRAAPLRQDASFSSRFSLADTRFTSWAAGFIEVKVIVCNRFAGSENAGGCCMAHTRKIGWFVVSMF